MRTYYIYKSTNTINGKVYIGQTSDFKSRKWQHERGYEKEDCIFHRALQKYGAENFIWEIIDVVEGKENANRAEKKYIEEYHSFKPNGYNMTKGGEGGSMWNARPIVCLTLDGKFVKRYDSAGQAEKNDGYCNSDVLVSCKNPNRTCKGNIFMFEDEYKKNGARSYQKPESTSKKRIIQCNQYGEYIATFDSVQEAAEKTGANRTTISGVLTKKYKKANGFIFVYENEFPIKNLDDYIQNKKGRKVAQINPKTNEVINIFDRISDAGKTLGVSYKVIHKVVDLPGRTAYGFKWISQ